MAGALRMIGKVENAITKQVTQRMVESEPWFEERTNQVNALQVILSLFCFESACILLPSNFNPDPLPLSVPLNHDWNQLF